MKKFFRHLRTHIFRGLLAIIPLILSYFVIRFFYVTVDKKVASIIEKFIGFKIPGLGIILVLFFLYLLGLTASNWAGRQAFNFIEKVTSRIPLIKTIYQMGKQLADAISLPEKQAFKRAVMVEHFRQGAWSVGFVTGVIADKKNPEEKLLRIFIPTAPNPTSGFMIVVKENQVRDLKWSVREAMNMIISGGIIGPQELE